MKKLAITLITIISLCCANISHAADKYVTAIIQGKGAPNATRTTAVTIGANEVAQVLTYFVTANGSADFIYVKKGGISVQISGTEDGVLAPNEQLVYIAGPATIEVNDYMNTAYYYYLTVKISPNPNIGGVGQ